MQQTVQTGCCSDFGVWSCATGWVAGGIPAFFEYRRFEETPAVPVTAPAPLCPGPRSAMLHGSRLYRQKCVSLPWSMPVGVVVPLWVGGMGGWVGERQASVPFTG